MEWYDWMLLACIVMLFVDILRHTTKPERNPLVWTDFKDRPRRRPRRKHNPQQAIRNAEWLNTHYPIDRIRNPALDA